MVRVLAPRVRLFPGCARRRRRRRSNPRRHVRRSAGPRKRAGRAGGRRDLLDAGPGRAARRVVAAQAVQDLAVPGEQPGIGFDVARFDFGEGRPGQGRGGKARARPAARKARRFRPAGSGAGHAREAGQNPTRAKATSAKPAITASSQLPEGEMIDGGRFRVGWS